MGGILGPCYVMEGDARCLTLATSTTGSGSGMKAPTAGAASLTVLLNTDVGNCPREGKIYLDIAKPNMTPGQDKYTTSS